MSRKLVLKITKREREDFKNGSLRAITIICPKCKYSIPYKYAVKIHVLRREIR
jgi:hypothetical protein